MSLKYLVVFERGATNWSAFSPDVPGCGSLGETLDETRANMREAIDVFLNETLAAGELIPVPKGAVVNFEEFDSEREAKQYVVEWMNVSIPNTGTQAA
jgi:predicted RNase H-like HicB family nuclease